MDLPMIPAYLLKKSRSSIAYDNSSLVLYVKKNFKNANSTITYSDKSNNAKTMWNLHDQYNTNQK